MQNTSGKSTRIGTLWRSQRTSRRLPKWHPRAYRTIVCAVGAAVFVGMLRPIHVNQRNNLEPSGTYERDGSGESVKLASAFEDLRRLPVIEQDVVGSQE